METPVLPSPAMAAPIHPRSGRKHRAGAPTKLTGCNLTVAERSRWDRLRAKRGDRYLSDTIRAVMAEACDEAGIVASDDRSP